MRQLTLASTSPSCDPHKFHVATSTSSSSSTSSPRHRPHHRHRHHHHRRHDRCVNIVLKPTPPHKFLLIKSTPPNPAACQAPPISLCSSPSRAFGIFLAFVPILVSVFVCAGPAPRLPFGDRLLHGPVHPRTAHRGRITRQAKMPLRVTCDTVHHTVPCPKASPALLHLRFTNRG